MSNTEKKIKQLNENKELRKQKQKVITPAVRILQVKNNLIILAHDLLVPEKLMIPYTEKFNYEKFSYQPIQKQLKK